MTTLRRDLIHDELAHLVKGNHEPGDLTVTYPIERPRRDPGDYSGPRPGLAETVMFCWLCRRQRVFRFTRANELVCAGCELTITREEAQ